MDYDVVINGGGPVGMGLAIELGQRGVRTAVVERYPEPQPIPKGQNLTQRTCEHFQAWGCEAELRAAHPVPEGAGIGGMTAYRTLLSGYTYDWLNRAAVRAHYYTDNARLPQYATERVLRARAAELASVDLLYGWQGERLEQDVDGVTLHTAEREGRRARALRSRWMVGCDGARSLTRAAAGITQTRSDHDRRMVLLVFRSTELHRLLERYPGKAFYCVLHPDYEGYWLFFGRVDHGESWFFHAPVPDDATPENHDFAGLLHRAVGQSFDLELTHVGFWDLRFAVADQYRRGRVFVAGDAAHSHPPYGGYGINTGLEDARNLGWKLAAELAGWTGPDLLDSYDAERRPVFASTADEFIARFIRDDRAFLERHAPESDPQFARRWSQRNLDAAEVEAYEPHYEGSPIVVGDGRPGARGRHVFRARNGHHLPPVRFTDGRAAQDVLGRGFTLLSLGAAPRDGFRDAADATGVPLDIVHAPSPEARETYGASSILVRPDQYIAWAGDGGDPACIIDRARGG